MQTVSWGRAEKRLFDYVGDLTKRILQVPIDDVADQSISQSAIQLLLLRVSAFLILNRSEITHGVIVVAVIAYMIVYLRLALLFGFIYMGLAKVLAIQFTFLDSMTTSLFMPLTFKNIPRSNAMQAAAGVHCFIVVALGFGAINAYLRRKLNAFRDIAESVWSTLDAEEVRSRINKFSKSSAPPSNTVRAPESDPSGPNA